MASLDISSDKLNPNTTTAKGFEKVIGVVASFIIKAQGITNKILYGKGSSNKDPKVNKFRKSLDRGLINLFKELSKIDFCNIINYIIGNAKFGNISFDPNNPPADTASDFEKKKWKVQKIAFDTQKIIDRYYSQFVSNDNIQIRLGFLGIVRSVNLSIDTLLDERNGLGDPTLTAKFPEINLISNYLQNIKKKFNEYAQLEVIPPNELKNFLDFVGKFKEILVAIQAISSPAALLASADRFTGGAIQEQLNIINKLIDAPSTLIPRLKDIIKLVQNIVSVGKSVIKYISLVKTIITLALLLIRIFNILKAFFVTLPIPTVYTTLGITNFMGKTYQKVLEEEGTKKLVARLSQINIVLSLMINFATSLVAGMEQILAILKIILRNLENCDNVDDSLKNELDSTIKDLEDTIIPLKKFLNDANAAEKAANSSFGEYTIEIIEEQLTDEGIRLKRRYGIARNANNIVVVQSTPTFASLDLIIINEVKVLLVSGGFVKTSLSELPAEDLATVMESMKYIGETDITLDGIQNNLNMDFGSLDESADDDLNNFTNNLPGGKALRKKIRKKMAEKSEALKKDLSDTDPNSNYSNGFTKQSQNGTNKDKIEELENRKKNILRLITAASSKPSTTAIVPKLQQKIKDIDAQLEVLRNE